MELPAGSKYFVQLIQEKGTGSPWIVRLYRKRLFFRKTVSSDWFLNGEQAKRFAEQLAEDLRDRGSTKEITGRKPGWTLHRSPQ